MPLLGAKMERSPSLGTVALEVELEALRRRVAELERDAEGSSRTTNAPRAGELDLGDIHASMPGDVFRRIEGADGSIKYAYVSGRLNESYGIDPAGLTADPEPFLNLIHPEDREGWLAANAAARESLAPLDHEYRIVTTAGEVRWERSIARVYRSENGETIFDGVAIDVTQQRELEAALRESTRLLTEITENVPGSVYRRKLHADGTISYSFVGGRIQAMLGFDEGNVAEAASYFSSAMHADDYDDWYAAIVESARTLTKFEHEYRLIVPSGDVVWLRGINGRPHEVEDGVVWDGVAIDITAHKRAQAELRRTEQRLMDIAANIPGNVFRRVLHADGRITFDYVSGASTSVFGVEGDAIMANAGAFIESIHPDDRERWRAAVESSARNRTEFEIEHRMVTPSGEVRWVRTMTAAPRAEGEETVWDGVTFDVTATKQAAEVIRENEALLRHAMQLARLGHWVWDETMGQMVYFSPELAAIHGLTNEEYLENLSTLEQFLQYVHAEDRERYERVFNETPRKPDAYVIEYRFRYHPEQEYQYFREIGEPVIDESGVLVRTIGTLQDITEAKRAEARLRAAIEDSELANRSKSDFLANTSHELRTPLNAIMGFSEIMMEETFGPVGNASYTEYVTDIFESARHLLSLINDLLDLSKLDAGKFDLDEEAVDVVETLRTCLRIVEGRAVDAGLKLEMSCPPGLPMLRADARALKQILLNLLSNSVKFTPSGGRIDAVARLDRDGGLLLTVIDTGVGISVENLPKVVLPFVQVDSGLDRKHEGTGLGLSLAKSLTEQLGGRLEIESELGAGTRAVAWFPADRLLSPSEGAVPTAAVGAGVSRRG